MVQHPRREFALLQCPAPFRQCIGLQVFWVGIPNWKKTRTCSETELPKSSVLMQGSGTGPYGTRSGVTRHPSEPLLELDAAIVQYALE